MISSIRTYMSRLKTLYHWLSKPVLLHWIMPYLMALIVVGTVAQKYIGLYESQRRFFSSFIFLLGPLPLPGGRLVTALLLVSLLAKLVHASPWRKATSGILISHLGVLLLLLGGLITAAFSTEGYVVLQPKQASDVFFDYHKRVLTISKNNTPVKQIAFRDLTKGVNISDTSLPFTLAINDVCGNCTMKQRSEITPDLKGPAAKIMLSPLDNYLEDERNLAGAEITVSTGGTYILFEPMAKQASFKVNNDTYDISVGRANYPLPFALQLVDAQKEVHPGTMVPRSYRSTVLLKDGELEQRAVITMNHPLRYKGYTVYQASFNESADAASTQSVSFAIVQNSGRVFPYVASITLCVGLLIHLCIRLPLLIRRKKHAQ